MGVFQALDVADVPIGGAEDDGQLLLALLFSSTQVLDSLDHP